jgi:hypothetical protein
MLHTKQTGRHKNDFTAHDQARWVGRWTAPRRWPTSSPTGPSAVVAPVFFVESVFTIVLVVVMGLFGRAAYVNGQQLSVDGGLGMLAAL